MSNAICYKFEGKTFCLCCARKRFGKRLNVKDTLDKEGNPIQPLFAIGEELYCDGCAEPFDLEIVISDDENT